MELINKAFVKSYELHKTQTRKMSEAPYFVHLLDTVKYLMYETDKEEVICAGFLHDALEDTKYTEEELLKEFGEDIFRLVKFCTEPDNKFDSTDEDQKKTWKMRKSHSLDKLNNGSEDECLVFCADKVANLLSMKEDLINEHNIWNKFNAAKEDIHWYYFETFKILQEKLQNKRILMIYKDLMTSVF